MWKCPKCAEECEDNFDRCWSCGTGRDGSPSAELSPERSSMVSDSLGRSERSRRRALVLSRLLSAVVAYVAAFLVIGFFEFCLLMGLADSPNAAWMEDHGLGGANLLLFLWGAALVLPGFVARFVWRRLGRQNRD